jgi:hypothetical protein
LQKAALIFDAREIDKASEPKYAIATFRYSKTLYNVDKML